MRGVVAYRPGYLRRRTEGEALTVYRKQRREPFGTPMQRKRDAGVPSRRAGHPDRHLNSPASAHQRQSAPEPTLTSPSFYVSLPTGPLTSSTLKVSSEGHVFVG